MTGVEVGAHRLWVDSSDYYTTRADHEVDYTTNK